MNMQKPIRRSVYVVLIVVYARDTIQWGLQDVLAAVDQNSLISIHHAPS